MDVHEQFERRSPCVEWYFCGCGIFVLNICVEHINFQSIVNVFQYFFWLAKSPAVEASFYTFNAHRPKTDPLFNLRLSHFAYRMKLNFFSLFPLNPDGSFNSCKTPTQQRRRESGRNQPMPNKIYMSPWWVLGFILRLIKWCKIGELRLPDCILVRS